MSMSASEIAARASAPDVELPQGGGDYASAVNVGDTERLLSVLGGAALAVWGLTRGRLGGLAMAALGGALIYRGTSGHCAAYQALGIDRRDGERQGNLGVKIEKDMLIYAPPEKIFAYWRNLENLPRLMSNVESVQIEGPTRSRWRVKSPVGPSVEWQAEIINEVPNRLIAWRTIDNAVVNHAGSVRFDPGFGGHGTMVRVSLQYDPIGGGLGHDLARWLGSDPGRQIEEDLGRLKTRMETAA